MDQRTPPSFEQYAAERLLQDREQITRDWIARLSSRLGLEPRQILPDPDLLDHMPVILERASEFLLVPEPEKLTAEPVIVDEMRNIALLRHLQGWPMPEVVREFDELAQVLDGAAFRWIADYPGAPEAESVGTVFGRLNRVPLLMGQIMVGALETERRNLLQQLASAEEQERARLSRELHDQLGQLLTGLTLGLKALKRGTGPGDQTARIEELERLADRIAREAQHLALGLRPPALDNLGLRAALVSLAAEWSERAGIECDFHSALPERERFRSEVETALYRVAQEGLNNVVKHAGATRVSLILERRGGDLTLVLEDDGRGFDVERTLSRPEKAKRLGVRGMRERVAWLGGALEIESAPGSGTSLFVRVPTAPAPGGDGSSAGSGGGSARGSGKPPREREEGGAESGG